jgi:hypothetical protein
MGYSIKNVQYDELLSLISFAICDNKCEGYIWKNNDNYNFAKYYYLLKELQDILPNVSPEIQELDDHKLDYVKSKQN